MKQTIALFLTMAAMQTLAQNKWTMQQCMLYAVEHNHGVRQARLDLDNDEAPVTLDDAVAHVVPFEG